jgi:hypothetical protein
MAAGLPHGQRPDYHHPALQRGGYFSRMWYVGQRFTEIIAKKSRNICIYKKKAVPLLRKVKIT